MSFVELYLFSRPKKVNVYATFSVHCLCHFPDRTVEETFFFFRLTCSVALWGGREGCCKQITLACARSASATLGLPPVHGTCSLCPRCSGSRLLRRDPSMAGPGLHAPPRSKPLRFRHSGSPQRRRLSWACVLYSSQVRAPICSSQASANAATYRLPATRLFGCKTGAPSSVSWGH